MQRFQQLYLTHFNDVYKFLLKLTGYRRDLAEELTQETFYHAIVSFSKFKGKCHIKTWLIQIAKNRFFTYLRRSKTYASFIQAESKKGGCFIAPSPHEQLENKEIVERLLIVLDDFDDRTRDVMLYRFLTDLPYTQISAIMNISEGSAKVIFYRGKVALQNKMREVYGYEI